MTVQTCLGVECTLIGYLELVHSIVVNLVDSTFLGILGCGGDGGSECAEGQTHENTIEPYLVGIDGLVPEYLVGDGAGLVLQLLHHRLHRSQVLSLGPLLVHAGDEMTSTYVVKVIIQDVVVANVALGVNHRVGIFLTVLADILTTIFKIGVEHTFQFNTHHVAPLGFL